MSLAGLASLFVVRLCMCVHVSRYCYHFFVCFLALLEPLCGHFVSVVGFFCLLVFIMLLPKCWPGRSQEVFVPPPPPHPLSLAESRDF